MTVSGWLHENRANVILLNYFRHYRQKKFSNSTAFYHSIFHKLHYIYTSDTSTTLQNSINHEIRHFHFLFSNMRTESRVFMPKDQVAIAVEQVRMQMMCWMWNKDMLIGAIYKDVKRILNWILSLIDLLLPQ